jgi:transcriptional regulator with XRE-family HTH domain
MNNPADLTESVAEEIRALMARRSLTQGDVALAIGRSQSYVSRALKGGRPFDVIDLGRLAVLLGVSPSTLLGPLADVVPPRRSPQELAAMTEQEIVDRFDLAAAEVGTQTVPPPLPDEQ